MTGCATPNSCSSARRSQPRPQHLQPGVHAVRRHVGDVRRARRVGARIAAPAGDPVMRDRTGMTVARGQGLHDRVEPDASQRVAAGRPRLLFFHECAHARIPTTIELTANCGGLKDMRDAGRAGPAVEEKLAAYSAPGNAYWNDTVKCAQPAAGAAEAAGVPILKPPSGQPRDSSRGGVAEATFAVSAAGARRARRVVRAHPRPSSGGRCRRRRNRCAAGPRRAHSPAHNRCRSSRARSPRVVRPRRRHDDDIAAIDVILARE